MALKTKQDKLLTLKQYTDKYFECLGGVLYVSWAEKQAGNLIQDCSKYTKADVKKEYDKYVKKEEKKKLKTK